MVKWMYFAVVLLLSPADGGIATLACVVTTLCSFAMLRLLVKTPNNGAAAGNTNAGKKISCITAACLACPQSQGGHTAEKESKYGLTTCHDKHIKMFVKNLVFNGITVRL
ncbi:MAG: hypothetical protein M9933_19135 [Chitinophagaceae bacterium]|nr:hypothetical protein [Chitinophagaceae bacterium]